MVIPMCLAFLVCAGCVGAGVFWLSLIHDGGLLR